MAKLVSSTAPHARDLRHQFASDNWSGVCPEAWSAMEKANAGHAASYGNDPWTTRASDLIRDFFETKCEVFFTFNGTAANSLALAALCQSYHSIICHELAHVETDECGGPEFFSNGTKLLLAPGEGGKITPAAVEHMVSRRTDIHYPKPRVLSITQSTEVGTVYAVDELETLCQTAKGLRLRVHMDGARFGNACAALGCKPKDITWKVGVDVLCLGGTKNGMAVGDAVVFFNLDLAEEFEYRCKQAGQLASKMRFLAAPWVGMLESGAYLRCAGHANKAAARLEAGLKDIAGLTMMHPRQANAVFVQMPSDLIRKLSDAGWKFYTFIGSGGVRLMCTWDTTDQDVDSFLADARRLSVGKE